MREASSQPARSAPAIRHRTLHRPPSFLDSRIFGCDWPRTERLLPKGQETGTLRLQDEAFVGFGAMIDGIMEKVEERLKILNARQRETVGWSMTLKLGQRVGSREAQGWSMVW